MKHWLQHVERNVFLIFCDNSSKEVCRQHWLEVLSSHILVINLVMQIHEEQNGLHLIDSIRKHMHFVLLAWQI